MYDNSDFFNDDLNFILTLSKEEYRYNDLLFNKMKKVMDNVRSMKGINKNIALEANRVYDDLNVRVNRLTDEISTVGYAAAMEEMSKGMMALIAAGIAAFVAMIWKIIGFLTGDSSSGGSSSGYGGGVSIQDKIKIEEVNSELLKEAVTGLAVVNENSDQVINTISNEAKKTPAFANEINSHNNNNNNIENYLSTINDFYDNYVDETVEKLVTYLGFRKTSIDNLLDENNDFNRVFSGTPNAIKFIKDTFVKLSSIGEEANYIKELNNSLTESDFKDYFSLETSNNTNSKAFDYLKDVFDKVKGDTNYNADAFKKHLNSELGNDKDSTDRVKYILDFFIKDDIFSEYLKVKTHIFKSSENFSRIANELDELLEVIKVEQSSTPSGSKTSVVASKISSFTNNIRNLVAETSNFLLSLQRSMEAIEGVVSGILTSTEKTIKFISSTRKSISISTALNESNKQALLSMIDKLSKDADLMFTKLKESSNKISSTELKESGAKKYKVIKISQSYKSPNNIKQLK